WLHEASTQAMGVVLNAGAYTHTSLALQDAVRAIATPVMEVHLSNIAARESVRNHSFISPFAAGVIFGLGPRGYLLALEALRAQAAEAAK
ncbi:MAG: type II 3-dehydroquinate dehydratase, partial [Alphaproteobacteria bacterium]